MKLDLDFREDIILNLVDFLCLYYAAREKYIGPFDMVMLTPAQEFMLGSEVSGSKMYKRGSLKELYGMKVVIE